MFKFEYDEDKKKVFFDFWRVTSFKAFDQTIAKPALVFFRFSQMELALQKAIGRFIDLAIKHRQCEIVDNKYSLLVKKMQVPRNEWELETDQINFLDDAHFFNFVQDRAFLSDGQDVVVATEVMNALLSGITALCEIPHLNPQPNSIEKDFKAWTNDLVDIYTHYFSPIRLGEKEFLKLSSKKSIKYGLDHAGEAKLFLGDKEPKKTETDASELVEIQASFVHQIDRYLFQKKVGSNTPELSTALLKTEESSLSEIFDELERRRWLVRYRKSNYSKKYNFLIRAFLSESPDLKIKLNLLSNLDLQPGLYSQLDLVRQMNRKAIQQKLPTLTPSEIEDFFVKIQRFKLIEFKSDMVLFDANSLQSYLGKRVSEPQKMMMVDSDMQMTIYRQGLSHELFYFLLSLTDLNHGDYMHTAGLDRKKALFASYFGWNAGRVVKMLKEHLSVPLDQGMIRHIQDFFQSAEGMEDKKAFLLTTPSALVLEKAMYSLKEASVPFRRLGTSKSKVKGLLFIKRKHYLQAAETLKQKNILLY